MKVVIAPDKYKGSLDAGAVGAAMARGVHRVDAGAKVVIVPMADGGEGTVKAVTAAMGGEMVTLSVTGPLGRPVQASYGIIGGGHTAVMEMAAASGLELISPDKRDPMSATTYGAGELIMDAARRGVSKIVMGIGGSATNDGGAGMAQALGARLLDAQGYDIPRGGEGLLLLSEIRMDSVPEAIKSIEFVVACDVDNPLYGPRGASAVYGPQKGATPGMIEILDNALKNFASVLQRDLGVDVAMVPGSGAAGGLGGGLMAFVNASLRSGVDLIMETSRLADRLTGADLVLTGEGRMDEQTLMGKVAHGVARVASARGIPVMAIVGSYSRPTSGLHQAGIEAVFAAQLGPASLEHSMANAASAVEAVSEQAYRAFLAGYAHKSMKRSCDR